VLRSKSIRTAIRPPHCEPQTQHRLHLLTAYPVVLHDLVSDTLSSDRGIWLLNLVLGGVNRMPVWSPAGKRIAFHNVNRKIVIKAADGSGGEEVLEGAQEWPDDWTKDGRHLVAATDASTPKTGSDLWAIPLPGGKPFVLRNSSAQESRGRVSRFRR
jgi:hypothetical protein